MKQSKMKIASLMMSAALMCVPAIAQTSTPSSSAQGSGSTASNSDQMGDHMGKHHGDRDHMKKMMDELNLTQDQRDQVKKLHEDGETQMKSIKSDTSLTAAQKKDKIKQLHQDHMSQVENILTPEQKTKWQQMKAEHKDKAGKRGMHKHKNDSTAPSTSATPKQ